MGVQHGFGPHVAEYRAAIADADRRLGMLLDIIRRRCAASPSEDWLVLVTTTGGGTARPDMPPALSAATAAAEWRRRHDAAPPPSAKAHAQGAGAAAAPPPRVGAYGVPGLPQHEAAFVLLWGPSVRSGEMLPTPRPVDVVPAALAHFGVLPRTDWALPGRAPAAVGGAVAWERAAARLPDTDPAAAALAAAPAEGAPSPLDDMSAEEVVAAAAAVASCGGVPLAFFASVPGLLDPQPMAVVGHRGAGMNAGVRDGAAVRENTVASFTAAAAAGATWVEMDVQVTSDGIPVIWHDDELLAREGRAGVVSHALRGLTRAQFQALGPAAAAPRGGGADVLTPAPGSTCGLLRRFKGAPIGAEAPWDCPAEAPLPTLEEALLNAPAALGFNLELKFVEHEPLTPPQLDAFLAAVLAVCERAAGSRRVFFSSFDPDAACGMRRLTARWPVMLLTDAAGDPGSGWGRHADARRNGVRAALAVAVAGGLAGVVTDADALLATPALVAEVRATGLLLATWGAANTQPELVRLQAQWGVCALITDSIRTALDALDDGPQGAAAKKRAAPVAGATPAGVRAAVAALPPFLGGGGALSDGLLRSHAVQDVHFTGHEGAVTCEYAPDGAVSVRQQPLAEDRVAGRRVLEAAMATPVCTCAPGLICHSCAFAASRGAGAPASPWPPGAAGSTAQRGLLVKPVWRPRGDGDGAAEASAAAAAPRAPGSRRLNLAQLLLPSPRLWRPS